MEKSIIADIVQSTIITNDVTVVNNVNSVLGFIINAKIMNTKLINPPAVIKIFNAFIVFIF